MSEGQSRIQEKDSDSVYLITAASLPPSLPRESPSQEKSEGSRTQGRVLPAGNDFPFMLLIVLIQTRTEFETEEQIAYKKFRHAGPQELDTRTGCSKDADVAY